MTVKELIEELLKMPQDARVFHLWDGEPRSAINIVYESIGGKVITADFEMPCYLTAARPKDYIEDGFNYYVTPENPNGYTNEDDWHN